MQVWVQHHYPDKVVKHPLQATEIILMLAADETFIQLQVDVNADIIKNWWHHATDAIEKRIKAQHWTGHSKNKMEFIYIYRERERLLFF